MSKCASELVVRLHVCTYVNVRPSVCVCVQKNDFHFSRQAHTVATSIA